MSAFGLAVVAFICIVAGAMGGLLARDRLPAHHLARESTDVVKIATGLMATLVALVLSLLISSANGFRQDIEREYRESMVTIGHLDLRLRAYGPETAPIRELLKQALAGSVRRRWLDEDFTSVPAGVADVHQALFEMERMLVNLAPAD